MPKKTATVPRLYDNFMALRDDIFRSLYCHVPGAVVAYDPSTGTATVQPGFKRVRPDGTIVPYPPLLNVPVFCMQGGGVGARFPVAAGDPCLLLVADRNIDAWFQNGGQSAPLTPRAHNLSDAFAVVGFNPQNAKLQLALDADEGGIADLNAKVAVKNGKVTIANQITTLLVLLDGLIDVVKAVTVTDETSTWPLSPASVLALQAYKAQLATLLY